MALGDSMASIAGGALSGPALPGIAKKPGRVLWDLSWQDGRAYS